MGEAVHLPGAYPTYIADICSRYYRPQPVSIGPYHHDHPNLKKMQIHKPRALHHFLDRSDKPKEAYLKVAGAEGAAAHGLVRGTGSHLAAEQRDCSPLKRGRRGKKTKNSSSPSSSSSFPGGNPAPETGRKIGHHLLDVFRQSLLIAERCTKKLPLFCTHNLLCLNNFVFRSAKELHAAEVQFQKMDKYGFEDMAFRDGVLSVPVMVVGDYYSKTAFLNLIAFERLHPDTHHEVTSYVFFIKSLITSAEDVALLRSEGILEIAMGTDESTAELFNKLVEDVYINPSSRAYTVLLQLQAFYMDSMKKWNKRLRRWRYYLKETHFRSPWTVLSLMAAVFLVAKKIQSLKMDTPRIAASCSRDREKEKDELRRKIRKKMTEIYVHEYRTGQTPKKLENRRMQFIPFTPYLRKLIGPSLIWWKRLRYSNRVSSKHHKHLNNPFPSAPKSLPYFNGSLFFNLSKLPGDQIFPIGNDFQLLWSSESGGYLRISHKSTPNKIIFSTVPGKAFVSAASADTEAEESRGSFVIKNGDVHFSCKHQSVEEIRVIDLPKGAGESNHLEDVSWFSSFEPNTNLSEIFEDAKDVKYPALLVTGWVFSRKKLEKFVNGDLELDTRKLNFRGIRRLWIVAKYWVLFDQKNSNQVGFQVKFGRPSVKVFPARASKFFSSLRGKLSRRLRLLVRTRGFSLLSLEDDEKEDTVKEFLEINRVFLTYSSEKDEKFYGFGEQFSYMEFKGRRVPIFVQEQGIGRGDQPITLAANLVSYRAGGDQCTTYAPSPFYMTSKMRSLYLEGYDYSIFDLTKHDRVQIQLYGSTASGRILQGESPAELIEHFTATSGRLPELPNWIISGAVVGMQGGTSAVKHVWEQLKEYDVPISAFWLQDWVGQRKTVIGSQLWWNWEVDKIHYPGWAQLVQDLCRENIRVMAYCNPCLVPMNDKPNVQKNLFDEAQKLGIFVKDRTGETYMMPNTAFDVGMLDFTHPATKPWFKQILREMVENGIHGWMADFGEGLPLDACLFSGEDPISAHNRYPELWAQINREFVDEWKSEGGNLEESLVFFVRAGFRESPRWAMLFWEGDQMVSWQKNDGIKSAVVGLLSSGLSGYAFNHSDIGGYCSVSVPFIRYQRDEELLLRWIELNAFNTVFRTHEGNKPSANKQFYSSSHTLSHFARFAKVYKAWEFYRIQLVKEGAQKGLPVSRHLFLHFPNDDHVHSLTYQQFLVGTEILVAPVVDKGKKEVKVYFPFTRGYSWKHIWTGTLYSRPSDQEFQKQHGCEAWVEAPIGFPAVFVKIGSSIGEKFLSNLRELHIL
ncbi:hypothetical protein H6P81_007806 [Aristolochia fimbriata]|uniref:Alpha-glucosidase n=1 Tax=Aristolochia fimbriata TaxID=158543 RepID=A0AAV7F4L0_ARIFI|nr:hypothetical protein H6P81_007806 [Aristolochia fimbriata]